MNELFTWLYYSFNHVCMYKKKVNLLNNRLYYDWYLSRLKIIFGVGIFKLIKVLRIDLFLETCVPVLHNVIIIIIIIDLCVPERITADSTVRYLALNRLIY